MADIVYRYYDGVYLNITNQCPCNCAFCIRSKGDAVGDAKEMWFDTEPTWQATASPPMRWTTCCKRRIICAR